MLSKRKKWDKSRSGEVPNQSKSAKRPKEKRPVPQREKQSDESEGREHGNALSKERKIGMIVETTIVKTGRNPMHEKLDGSEKTERPIIKCSENDTRSNALTYLEKLRPEDTSVTPPEDSKLFLTLLKEENSGSIKLLDDSARQLIGYANQLATPKTKCDETGEILQRGPSHAIMDAVKCLEASRNAMKTKLDYLKFGRELLNETKTR